MLRDAGVRTKLLAVLAIPTVLLVVVTTLLVGGQFAAASQAGQVNGMTDVAVQVNRVVHSLQEERSATLRYLAGPDVEHPGRDARPAPVHQPAAPSAGHDHRQLAGRPDVRGGPDAVRLSTSGHGELKSARASIDHQRSSPPRRTSSTARSSGRPRPAWRHRLVGTPELAQRLQAYGAISSAIEYAAHERDLVEVGLLRGTLTEADFAQSAALVAQQRQSLQDFQRNAPAAASTGSTTLLAKSEVAEIDQVRRSLPDLLKGTTPTTAAR
jgi:hypothetical protein